MIKRRNSKQFISVVVFFLAFRHAAGLDSKSSKINRIDGYELCILRSFQPTPDITCMENSVFSIWDVYYRYTESQDLQYLLYSYLHCFQF